MIKRKKGKAVLVKDVEMTNRWGCGCLAIFLFGIVLAMIIAGLMKV